jgi:hypothetical protein
MACPCFISSKRNTQFLSSNSINSPKQIMLKQLFRSGIAFSNKEKEYTNMEKIFKIFWIEVNTYYIIISSLGILQNQTYSDFLKLLRIKGSGKRQLVKKSVRRMIMQACRGSFELWKSLTKMSKKIVMMH